MFVSRRLPRLLLFVVALLATPYLSGCDALSSLAGPKTLQFDEPRLLVEVDARATKAASTKKVEEALNATIEAVSKDPALAAAGEPLMANLGQAPNVAKAGAAIIAKLGSSKEMLAIIQKLASEQPGATPEQITAMVGKRVDAAVNAPAFNTAFDEAFDVLLAKPSVNGAFERFGGAVANNKHMNKALHAVVSSGLTDMKAGKRLTELNGGEFPDKARATDLLLEHAFSEARLETFFVEFFSLPSTRRHLAAAITELMKQPSAMNHLSKAVSTIMLDPGFEKHAMGLMTTMLSDNPRKEDISASLSPVLSSKATETALVTLINGAMADPVLQDVGDKAVAAIANDPEVVAALKKLLIDW